MSGNEGPIRIGDQEREDAVTRLGAHYEAGRLSADEHQERVGEALQAKTEADLATLFADLPGERNPGTPGAGGPGSSGSSGSFGSGEEQGWAGPWGWARSPWTAPGEQSDAAAAGRAAYGGGGGPWAGGRGSGFLGRVPLPVLIALAVVGVLASIGCVVGGGHPPFLPLLLIVAGIFIVRRRRQERRA